MIRILLFAFCTIFGTHYTYAKEWPTRQIRIIVPFPPGGGNDVTTRILSKHLSVSLKQPIIIENKPGASGTTATKIYLTSPPDDHIFIIGTTSNIVFSSIIQKQYAIRDINPISLIGVGNYVLTSNTNLNIKTIPDLILKAKTQTLSYSSGGLYTGSHLSMLYFSKTANIELKHIPYPGGNPAMIAVARNEVDISMSFGWNSIKQYVDENIITPITTTGNHQVKIIPELPTISMYIPDFETSVWYGLFGRNEYADSINNIMQNEIAEIIDKGLLSDSLTKEGLISKSISSSEFRNFIENEHNKWMKIL